MMRTPLTLLIVMLVAVAISSAEEIETRKTVKKSSAIEVKELDEPITNSAEAQTVQVEVVARETTTATPTTTLVTQVSTTEKFVESSTVKKEPTTEAAEEPTTKVAIQPTIVAVEPTTKAAIESTTVAVQSTTVLEVPSSTPEFLSTVSEISHVSEVESTFESPESEEDSSPDLNNILPLSETPKRKVIYINQQQNGKLNVHLELSDVSVIVIPNQKDPQLSLLNLLFKSAQKSNLRNEAKKKEENANAVDHHDEYSKYKQHSVRGSDESYNLGAPNMPLVESRIPYKVDISSTLGQQSQPAVDIMPNSQHHLNPSAKQQFQPQFARVPIMQSLKPIPYTMHAAAGQTPQSKRIFKRSIDSRLLGLDAETSNDGEHSLDYYNDDELTESNFNSLDSEEDFNAFASRDESQFVLLGAVENCGPGRKRNSYQICVAVDDIQ